jgi:hypothetical protein
VEDGYEFFAKRQLVTIFSAPNYCGEFDNAGAMMSVDDTLMWQQRVTTWNSSSCSQGQQILKYEKATWQGHLLLSISSY